MKDQIDDLLAEWHEEKPELDYSALGIVVRIQLLGNLLKRDAEAALSDIPLKLWEYDVLSALRRKGKPYEQAATELARLTMLTSGAMTTRIDGLEEKGLVRRTTDPEDRRGVNVRLSEKGLRTVDEAIRLRLEAAEAQLTTLTDKERAALSGGLRKMLITMTTDC